MEAGASPEVFEELLRLEAMCFQLLRCLREKGLKEKVETNVSGVTGDGSPLLTMPESLYQSSVAAAGKSQNASALRRCLYRELGDQPGKKLSDQEILPVPIASELTY